MSICQHILTEKWCDLTWSRRSRGLSLTCNICDQKYLWDLKVEDTVMQII